MKSEHQRCDAFVEQIYEHQLLLRRLCSVYAVEPADREDLYQEMVLQAWRSFGSYKGRSKFSTWLYRVALNTALLSRRKHSARREFVSALCEPPDRAVCRDSAAEEDAELLYACIHELPKVDRAIILLHLERHTYDEIADIMGFSRGNVSVRLVRIKEKLRTLLLAKGYREE